MFGKRLFNVVMLCVCLATLLGSSSVLAAQVPMPDGPEAAAPGVHVSIYATGLDNPRGLKFGVDHKLYVAEGGLGGSESTEGQCEQVVPPVGPYTGSPTGSRISLITRQGKRTTVSTVAEGFPSSQTAPEAGSFVTGVADIAFIRNRLYAVTAGSGCSHGVAGTTNAVFQVHNNEKKTSQVADLSAFYQANPVANPYPPDFEPGGTPYSMVAVEDALYVLEANHGELDRVTPDGQITRIVDISATQGHIVPTAMVYHDGAFYVGNLYEFPAEPHSNIYRIEMDGSISVVAEGLTVVLGVAFDDDGHLYALETSAPATMPGPPVLPGTGRVVRIEADGTLTPIATGLNLPTAMTYGPDGALYVSNNGFNLGPAEPGFGQIVRIGLDD